MRGASKDILNETERNLQDALHVARNITLNPRLVPGGGAIEMAVSQALLKKQAHGPYRALAHALGNVCIKIIEIRLIFDSLQKLFRGR